MTIQHTDSDILKEGASLIPVDIENQPMSKTMTIFRDNFQNLVNMTGGLIEGLKERYKKKKISAFDMKNLLTGQAIMYDKVIHNEERIGRIKNMKNYEGIMKDYTAVLNDLKKLASQKQETSIKQGEYLVTSHNDSYVNLTPGSNILPPPLINDDASLTAEKNKVQKEEVVVVDGVELSSEELL
jgi:hypothetical protein